MGDKTNKWIRQCFRKEKRTLKEVEKIIKKQQKKGKQLYYYACPHCFGYHLTKIPQENIQKQVKQQENILNQLNQILNNEKPIIRFYKYYNTWVCYMSCSLGEIECKASTKKQAKQMCKIRLVEQSKQ